MPYIKPNASEQVFHSEMLFKIKCSDKKKPLTYTLEKGVSTYFDSLINFNKLDTKVNLKFFETSLPFSRNTVHFCLDFSENTNVFLEKKPPDDLLQCLDYLGIKIPCNFLKKEFLELFCSREAFLRKARVPSNPNAKILDLDDFPKLSILSLSHNVSNELLRVRLFGPKKFEMFRLILEKFFFLDEKPKEVYYGCTFDDTDRFDGCIHKILTWDEFFTRFERYDAVGEEEDLSRLYVTLWISHSIFQEQVLFSPKSLPAYLDEVDAEKYCSCCKGENKCITSGKRFFEYATKYPLYHGGAVLFVGKYSFFLGENFVKILRSSSLIQVKLLWTGFGGTHPGVLRFFIENCIAQNYGKVEKCVLPQAASYFVVSARDQICECLEAINLFFFQ